MSTREVDIRNGKAFPEPFRFYLLRVLSVWLLLRRVNTRDLDFCSALIRHYRSQRNAVYNKGIPQVFLCIWAKIWHLGVRE